MIQIFDKRKLQITRSVPTIDTYQAAGHGIDEGATDASYVWWRYADDEV